MTDLTTQLRYWRYVLLRAWRETIAAQLRLAPTVRRGLMFVVILGLLYGAGELQPVEHKMYSALLALAAFAAVFALEVLYRVATLPARAAAEVDARLAEYASKESAHAASQRAVAEFQSLFSEGLNLLEQTTAYNQADQILRIRARVEEWDSRANCLLNTHAPTEQFGYATTAALPHSRGFVSVNNLTNAGEALHQFMSAKLNELRLIGMKLAARGNDEAE